MRIVVLADDLSGAAELAGIACTHGLAAEVQRRFEPASEAEVLAVDSDSRGLPALRAAELTGDLAQQIVASRPEWIFKKVDSVLRGNPRAEIEAVLQATGQRRAVLIPANPCRGRVISGGRYLIDGVPLDQTQFANDPDHPRHSARMETLLGSGGLDIHFVDHAAPLSADGILVPDALDVNDLRTRARELDESTLPAGAADFFAALLEQQTGQAAPSQDVPESPAVQCPALLVCGSRTAWPQRRQACLAAGMPVLMLDDASRTLPDATFGHQRCATSAVEQLSTAGVLILATGSTSAHHEQRNNLLARLASVVALVLHRTPIATLLIEGGATAAAIADRLDWTRFAVAAAAPSGIGILQPLTDSRAPLVFMKPGSYSWPDTIWQEFCCCRRHR